jgi:predicted PolB exonuclease-like 3'-5' exonuclease
VSGKADEQFADDSFVYKSRTEKQLLEDFWESAPEYSVFVSFNGRAFDIPFLYIRSIALGVQPTVEIARARYVNKQTLPYHVDIFDEFSFHGAVNKKPSLSSLCDAFGVQNPKLFMSGEDITEFFLAKKIDEIAKYNGQDVLAITKLYEKWLKYLAPKSFIHSLELS